MAEPAVTLPAVEEDEAEKVHFDFDAGFQSKIAALCLRDSAFMQRVDGLIEPEHFENASEAALVHVATSYYKRYKKAPADKSTIAHLIKKALTDKIMRKEIAALAIPHVGALWSVDISDRDFVIDEVATFARHQAVSKAILASVEHLDKRNFSDIQKALQTALNVGASSDNAVYSYGAEIDHRTEERLERAAGLGPLTGVTTGYRAIDTHLYHKGWGLRELSVLMGGAKSGKTTALINFGINAVSDIKRFNILYCTLEVSAKIIADRIDANVSNCLMFELGEHIHDVKAKVKEWHDKAGRFDIIEFPTGTMRVSDLRRLIERKKAEGIKYDLVIVDYADLMAPERVTDNSIENSKSVYVNLRGLAMEENIAVLTATQTNREGSKAAVAKMEHVAEDFNKIRIADVIISINKTDEERALNQARLYFAAIRNGPSGFSIRIQQDIDRMKFITDVLGAE